MVKGICSFAVVILLVVVIGGAAGGSGNVESDRRASTQRRATSAISSSSSATRISRNYPAPRIQSYTRRSKQRYRVSTSPGFRSRVKTTSVIQRARNNTESSGRPYYIQYSPTQRTLYARMNVYNRQLKYLRAEHRRFSKDINRAKGTIMKLEEKCEEYERNSSYTMRQMDKQKKEFQKYQTETVKEFRNIAKHQQSQDLQYFEVFEATNNNTAELSKLQTLVENLHMYEDISDNIPDDKSWNAPFAAQDLQLKFETITDDEGRIEEIIGRSYQRVTDEVDPRLENQDELLQQMQDSMQRQSDKLEQTSSSVRELRSTLDSSLSAQVGFKGKLDETNRTLQKFHIDLKSTVIRLNDIEEKAENQRLAFSTIQLSVAQINESLNERRAIRPAGLRVGGDPQVLDRIDRMSQVLDNEMEKMANLTEAVRSAEEDIRYLTMATSNFYAILTKQAKVIHQQNVTLSPMIVKAEEQENRIADLENDLNYYHETVMKLLNIVTNIGQQIRRPVPQHKDCHDLWISGHTENGVYTVVHDMTTKELYCNMTDNGGWTLIQRRNDGIQDFDRTWKEYKNGFGNIYGEFWMGLDSMRWLTNGRIYTLMVILEDWGRNRRYAIYDQFGVYGNDYTLRVSGYNGDAGDSLSQSNNQGFKVRHQASLNDCASSHKSGWWFPKNCGDANPNGPYSRTLNEVILPEGMNGAADNEIGEVFYITWRGEDFPLKKITMQIAPREAVNQAEFSFLFTNDTKPVEVDANAPAMETTTQSENFDVPPF